MINGVHALIYAKDADRALAFFKDVLGFKFVDAGEGRLFFALPPAEVGIHSTDGEMHHELYFMCDDVKKTIAELEAKGVACSPPDAVGWGVVTSFEIPGGGRMGLYEPRHPTAHGKPRAPRAKARKALAKAKPAKRTAGRAKPRRARR